MSIYVWGSMYVCMEGEGAVYIPVCFCTGFQNKLLSVHYGAATISSLLKIIGLFCKRAL